MSRLYMSEVNTKQAWQNQGLNQALIKSTILTDAICKVAIIYAAQNLINLKHCVAPWGNTINMFQHL